MTSSPIVQYCEFITGFVYILSFWWHEKLCLCTLVKFLCTNEHVMATNIMKQEGSIGLYNDWNFKHCNIYCIIPQAQISVVRLRHSIYYNNLKVNIVHGPKRGLRLKPALKNSCKPYLGKFCALTVYVMYLSQNIDEVWA